MSRKNVLGSLGRLRLFPRLFLPPRVRGFVIRYFLFFVFCLGLSFWLALLVGLLFRRVASFGLLFSACILGILWLFFLRSSPVGPLRTRIAPRTLVDRAGPVGSLTRARLRLRATSMACLLFVEPARMNATARSVSARGCDSALRKC